MSVIDGTEASTGDEASARRHRKAGESGGEKNVYLHGVASWTILTETYAPATSLPLTEQRRGQAQRGRSLRSWRSSER